MKKNKKKVIIKIPETTDKKIKSTIGAKIKQVRMARGQSAERVAKKLGISRVALTHIENGRNNINCVKLWKLCCVLGCNPTELLPYIPEGFSLTKIDYKKIAKEDERAVEWAKKLFQ